MEIYYLYNSGFSVLLRNTMLVFDYYRTVTDKPDKNIAGGIVSPVDLLKKQTVCFFSSHSHPDHFNPSIFKLQDARPDIRYFLDAEIKENVKGKDLNFVSFMQKGDIYENDGILIKAFGSTDIGSSFYVEAEGCRLFHAGDLNFWHWRESSDEAYVEEARRAFAAEMAFIETNIQGLDVAFFPVDPAMGEGYDEGAAYFIRAIKPKYFIPMHCRGSMLTFDDFKQKMLFSETEVLIYHERGEKLVIDL